jgi:urease subunit beta
MDQLQQSTKTKSTLYPDKTGFKPDKDVIVGGVITYKDEICYNVDRQTLSIKVRNTGDRPIQVGSHFHFFEVNRYMEFDRSQAFGMHLNIPATTAVRFEPGEEKEVELVAYGGKQRILGFNGLTEGYAGQEDKPDYLPVRYRAARRAKKLGFKCTSADQTNAINTTTPKQ